MSPPLTAGSEHFEMIAQGIEYGLQALREDARLAAQRAVGAMAA